jgi:uncharacterized protein (DUF2132 family)
MSNPFDFTNPSKIRPTPNFDYERESIFKQGLPDLEERLQDAIIEINLPGGGGRSTSTAKGGIEKTGVFNRVFGKNQQDFFNFVSKILPNTGLSARQIFGKVIKDPSPIKSLRFLKKTFFDREHGMDKKFFKMQEQMGFPVSSYYSRPTYMTTYARNQLKKTYSLKVEKLNFEKNNLVSKFKNNEISRGKFLEQKNAIDKEFSMINRDLNKLGMEVVFPKPGGKTTTYGGSKNLAYLFKDIPRSYRLNIVPRSKMEKTKVADRRKESLITKPPGLKKGGIVNINDTIKTL